MIRTLTYWIADSLGDSSCYSVRERTRKACADAVAARNAPARTYGKPRKVEVHYTDKVDLVQKLLGEGGAEGMAPAEEYDDE
jgi:hypothetical protein